ncbi:MAG: hypothetical protein ABIQ95_02155 [Bdellovibrionia bacterium]
MTDNACIRVAGAFALIKANRLFRCEDEGIRLDVGNDGRILENFIRGIPDDDQGIMAGGDRIEIAYNKTRETSDNGISLEGNRARIHHNDIKISGADDIEPGISKKSFDREWKIGNSA